MRLDVVIHSEYKEAIIVAKTKIFLEIIEQIIQDYTDLHILSDFSSIKTETY